MKVLKILMTMVLAVFCFCLGAYFWSIQNTGKNVLTMKGPGFLGRKPGDSVVAEVAGQPIFLGDVEFETRLLTKDLDEANLTSAEYEQKLKPLREKVFNTILERRILFEFIKSKKEFGADKPERLVACQASWEKAIKTFDKLGDEDKNRLKSRLCEKSLIDQYNQEYLAKNEPMSEDELRAYYKANKGKYSVPETVKIRQIVVAQEQDAQRVMDRLNKNNFSQMVREHSIGPESKNGGVLGPFKRGELPLVFDSAFQLAEGQISKILKSTYGFHIFIVDEKKAARDLNFQEAKKIVKAQLTEERNSKAFREWVNLAIHSTKVKLIKSL